MVGRDSGTIDFLKPIYIVIHEERILLTRLTGTSSVRTEFISGEDVQMLEHGTEGNVTIIGHFHLRTGFTFLGRNEDDTVRSTGTVDSGSGRILEDGEGLDIVRVHQRERVGDTLNTIVIHSKSIDDDQRVVGSVQRRTTTNTDRSTTTRSTTIGRNVHTGDLTLDHVLCVGLQTFVHVIGFDSGNRTGSIVFLNDTITHNDYFVQDRSIFA